MCRLGIQPEVIARVADTFKMQAAASDVNASTAIYQRYDNEVIDLLEAEKDDATSCKSMAQTWRIAADALQASTFAATSSSSSASSRYGDAAGRKRPRTPPYPCYCGELHWREDCPTKGVAAKKTKADDEKPKKAKKKKDDDE